MTVPAELPGTNLISVSMLPNKNVPFDCTPEPENDSNSRYVKQRKWDLDSLLFSLSRNRKLYRYSLWIQYHWTSPDRLLNPMSRCLVYDMFIYEKESESLPDDRSRTSWQSSPFIQEWWAPQLIYVLSENVQLTATKWNAIAEINKDNEATRELAILNMKQFPCFFCLSSSN